MIDSDDAAAMTAPPRSDAQIPAYLEALGLPGLADHLSVRH